MTLRGFFVSILLLAFARIVQAQPCELDGGGRGVVEQVQPEGTDPRSFRSFRVETGARVRLEGTRAELEVQDPLVFRGRAEAASVVLRLARAQSVAGVIRVERGVPVRARRLAGVAQLQVEAGATSFAMRARCRDLVFGELPSESAEAADDAETRAETGRTETGRTETGRTETGRTETGRTETGRTETGRTETGRTETGRAETGRTETGRTARGVSGMPMVSHSRNKQPRRNVLRVYAHATGSQGVTLRRRPASGVWPELLVTGSSGTRTRIATTLAPGVTVEGWVERAELRDADGAMFMGGPAGGLCGRPVVGILRYAGPATLAEGAALLDDRGQAWARTTRALQVEIVVVRTGARSDAPGTSAEQQVYVERLPGVGARCEPLRARVSPTDVAYESPAE